VLIYKSIRGFTAPYLTADCQVVTSSGRRRLWLADVNTYRTADKQDRSFTVTGPQFWNTLPAVLRQPDIELVTFRWLLKTYLFKCDPGI